MAKPAKTIKYFTPTEQQFKEALIRHQGFLKGEENSRCLDLVYVDLTALSIIGVDLAYVDLTGVKATEKDLTAANLGTIKNDIFQLFSAAPNEVSAVLKALQDGKIDGASYTGTCACFIGTIAKTQKTSWQKISGIAPNTCRPAERWILALSEGDTPSTSPVAAITERWIHEWISETEKANLSGR